MNAKQISIIANSALEWTTSTFTAYYPPDSNGFLVKPITRELSSLNSTDLSNAIISVSYFINDAITNGYVVQAMTVNQIEDHIESIIKYSNIINTNISTFDTIVTTYLSVSTSTTNPDTLLTTTIISDPVITTNNTNSVILSSTTSSSITLSSLQSPNPITINNDPIITIDSNSGASISTVTSTITSISIQSNPVFVILLQRPQYTIQVSKTRNVDGNLGCDIIKTETLPSTVRDAWIAIAGTL